MRSGLFPVLVAAVGIMLYSGSALAGTSAIPEPATFALLATGIGALAVAKFRKRK